MGSKLPLLSGREVVKALGKKGFVLVGMKGSHRRLKLKTEKTAFIATVPMYNQIPRGTLKIIIRQTGLTEEEFLELL